MKLQVTSCKLQVARRHQSARKTFDLQPSTFNLRRAFTLIELLVVISILALLAGLSVPALKNLGKSNVAASASRQLLDDIGRARQLAISRHTTVYMVFVPTNFWGNTTWFSGLTAAQLAAVTNLVDKQLTGYNFISYGKLGDQPGRHDWTYLSDWQSLPDGTFIAPQKFLPQIYPASFQLSQWQTDYASQIDQYWLAGRQQVYGFASVTVPFPTENSPLISLPCLTFNHLGRLVSETPDGVSFHHAYLPLAQGRVDYGRDINKALQLTYVPPAGIVEIPPGNSTGISYNVIDVDPLTGRATQQFYKMP